MKSLLNVDLFITCQTRRSLILVFSFLFFVPSFLDAQWTQIGQNLPGEGDYDQYGVGLSISGDGTTLAAGSHQNSANGYNKGHVKVFRLTGGSWVQQGSDIEGEEDTEGIGYAASLSFDGSIVAIGGVGNSGIVHGTGHLRVYQWLGGAWVKKADFKGSAAQYLGRSVSLSSDGLTLAAGANGAWGSGIARGLARVYQNISGSWVQKGNDIEGEADFDFSAESVALSDDATTLAIGASFNDAGGIDRGNVRVFRYVGGTWIQLGGDLDGETDNDQAGVGVSLSGNGSIVAVGEWLYAAGGLYRGRVRVFELNGNNWIQQGQDIVGTADEDYCGGSVSLSADGLTLAVGAEGHSSIGMYRGQTRIYHFDGNNWVKIGTDIDGQIDFGAFGARVSISDDGSIVAAAAPYSDDAGGIYRGMVRAYNFISLPDADCDGIADSEDICPGGDDGMDNNSDGLPDCHFLPAYDDIISAWKCENNKVLISHFSEDGTCHTLCVNYSAVQAHLNHGDNLGPCNNASCSNGLFVQNDSNDAVDEGASHSANIVYQYSNDLLPIKIYPNPSNNEFFLRAENSKFEETTIHIYNYIGTFVETIRVLEKDVLSFGANYLPGIYFIRVERGQNEQHYTIIKSVN